MQSNTVANYTSSYSAITDVTSDELDNLVLLFGDTKKGEFQALAFQIQRTHRRVERMNNSINLSQNGNTGDALDFGILGENGHAQAVTDPGDEILQVWSQRESTIVEWGISVDADGVLVGAQSPGSVPLIGVTDASQRVRGWSTEQFQDFGAVESDKTRVAAPDPVPTTALSASADQGIFRVDSDQEGKNPMRFAFLNTQSASVTFNVTAVGASYEVSPVTDEATLKQMLRGDGYKRRVVSYGGKTNGNPNLPRDWYDYVARLDDEEVVPPL